MPEGDTLHRVANRLRPALVGAELRRFDAPHLVGPRPRLGHAIRSVDAVGKHLLVGFGDGVVLQTHLRMTGAWHLYRPGERWRKPTYLARAVVGVDDAVAVCFSAPLVRTHLGEPASLPAVEHLGPDLCQSDPDLDEVVSRMSRFADDSAEIADVLLDQRVASGVGNIYKSEVLWACRQSPFSPLGAVAAAQRRSLAATAARLLRANLSTPRRTTVPGGLAVYGRSRRPCRRCGTLVRVTRPGPQRRTTYWCPTCQPEARDGATT